MKNIPKKIYLQIGEDNNDADFSSFSEVTWSADRIFKNDIEYVLKDAKFERQHITNIPQAIGLISGTIKGMENFNEWGNTEGAIKSLKEAVTLLEPYLKSKP